MRDIASLAGLEVTNRIQREKKMSSKLNRAARRAGKGNISNLKEQIFFEEKDNPELFMEQIFS